MKTEEDIAGLIKYGKWVYRKRISKYLTVAEFARKAKLSRSSITQIEQGKRNVRFPTMLKIARAFDMNLGEFFEGYDADRKITT